MPLPFGPSDATHPREPSSAKQSTALPRVAPARATPPTSQKGPRAPPFNKAKLLGLLAWSLSDLWKGFLPRTGREGSALTEGDELDVEFGGLLEGPSDGFASQAAGGRREIKMFSHSTPLC